jgi:hypothetical protein
MKPRELRKMNRLREDRRGRVQITEQVGKRETRCLSEQPEIGEPSQSCEHEYHGANINRNNQIDELEIPADRDCVMQEGERMHEVNCCCTPHEGLTNREKGYPNSQTLLSLNIDDKKKTTE